MSNKPNSPLLQRDGTRALLASLLSIFIGLAVGAIVVAIVRNAMVLLEISTYYQQIVTGAVILIAVIIDTQRKARAAKRVD